jgi:hypothetical protein
LSLRAFTERLSRRHPERASFTYATTISTTPI